MWQILVLEFIICIIFSLYLYKKYGSYTRRPYYVTLLTLMGWILCFYIVFLIPNDVSQAAQCDMEVSCTSSTNITNYYDYSDDEPGCHCFGSPCTGEVIVPFTVIVYLWRAVYWITLFATWTIFPLMQTYSMTGEFSFGEKMRMSIKSNLLLYALMGTVLAIIGVIYILESGVKWSSVPGTAMAAANAYGLFMIIAMLGHGLVNVPRRMWNSANLALSLKKLQFEVADYDNKLHDAKLHLTKTLKKVRKVSETTSEDDAFRKYIDIILTKCPKEFESVLFGEGNIEISYKTLASLHAKLMQEDHAVRLWESLLKNTLEKAMFLEDVINSKGNPNYKIKWSFQKEREGIIGKSVDTFQYIWYCYLQTRLLQLFSIFCILVSVTIVWSELFFFICKIDLSIYSLYIRAIRLSPPFILQIAIILPVVYIAWCTYSSLFQLRLFNYYHLVPHSKTDSNSLLFSAAYLCRLTSPMAYNFMEMAHYKNTAFVVVIGELDSNWAKYFQEFFPILLLPFILMTLFNVYSKILSLLRIKRFQFDDDFNDELIDDGKGLVDYERDKRRRDQGIEMEEIINDDGESAIERRADSRRNSPSNSSENNSNNNIAQRSSRPNVRSRNQSNNRNNEVVVEELPIETAPVKSNSFFQKVKNVFGSNPKVATTIEKEQTIAPSSELPISAQNDQPKGVFIAVPKSSVSHPQTLNDLSSFNDDEDDSSYWNDSENPFQL